MDNIEFLYSLIGYPLGFILWAIYEVICKNTGASIGIAILVFTFIVKLAMLPLSIRQQKNSAKSAIFAPKVREIQQKYKNNQEKQQQELAKLQSQGYNPMGGCGSMLITFLLLFGVLDVVYKPMTHITRMDGDTTKVVLQESYYVSMAKIFVDEYGNTEELSGDRLTKHEEIIRDAAKIIEYYNTHCATDEKQPVTEEIWKSLDGTSKNVVKDVITAATLESFNADNSNDLFLESDLFSITKAEQEELNSMGDEVKKNEYKSEHAFGAATKAAVETVQRQFGSVKAVSGKTTLEYTQSASLQRELYAINRYGEVSEKDPTGAAYTGISDSTKAGLAELNDRLEFMGIPLGQDPASNLGWPMILIPILAFVFSMIQTLISNKTMEMNSPEANTGCMKVTMFIMPIFSIVLVFTVPAGAGFYWTISYVFGIAQTLILNKFYNPAKLREQAEAEYNERMKEAAKAEKRKRQQQDLDAVAEYKGEKLTQKEINRRKLAEARKADAEKYGEEYHEEDDEDT